MCTYEAIRFGCVHNLRCTCKWIKRIVVVCEIWTTHQGLWWVCTHVGRMIIFCRRCFVIWEVFVYRCIKLSVYQGICMCEAIHVSRYIHVHHNSSQNIRIHHPHVHQDLISTCTSEFDVHLYTRVRYQMTKNGGWDDEEWWLRWQRTVEETRERQKRTKHNTTHEEGVWR